MGALHACLFWSCHLLSVGAVACVGATYVSGRSPAHETPESWGPELLAWWRWACVSVVCCVVVAVSGSTCAVKWLLRPVPSKALNHMAGRMLGTTTWHDTSGGRGSRACTARQGWCCSTGCTAGSTCTHTVLCCRVWCSRGGDASRPILQHWLGSPALGTVYHCKRHSGVCAAGALGRAVQWCCQGDMVGCQRLPMVQQVGFCGAGVLYSV